MKETIDPNEYAYSPDQVIMLPAPALLNIMAFMEEISDSQPKIAALLDYPKTVEYINDNYGNLVAVDIDWQAHTPDSFFITANSPKGGVSIMTPIGLKAKQLQYSLQKIHEENINKGYAKRITDLNEQDAISKIK